MVYFVKNVLGGNVDQFDTPYVGKQAVHNQTIRTQLQILTTGGATIIYIFACLFFEA